MTVGREIREPWAFALGGLAAGLGWAVGTPALAAACIGVTVYGVEVAAGVLANRRRKPRWLPRLRPGSPQEAWLRRAEDAARALARLQATAPFEAAAGRVSSMTADAHRIVDDVRLLAGQSARVDSALAQLDAARLQRELERLDDELDRASDPGLRAELQGSLHSIRAQADARARLEEAAATLRAKTEAVVLGLESVVARVVEVLAVMPAAPASEGVASLDALAAELERSQAGVTETEEVSRRALVAYVGQRPAILDRRTPAWLRRVRHLPAPTDATEVRASLDGLLASIRGRVPDDIYGRVATIRDSILLTLADDGSADGTDPTVYLIRQTALDYLPGALRSYLTLPPEYADRPITAEGRPPHQTLLDQLDLMDRKMREVADDLVRHDADRLVAHGRFLRARFGVGSLRIADVANPGDR